jgi:predicted aminopeptidase
MLRDFKIVFLVCCCLLLDGCYYLQAVRGHMDLMTRAQPIAELVDEPQLTDELRSELQFVQEIRQFSIEHLLLADNKSYRKYADLQRNFVVWNVFAAKEFELSARRWCFPVAGCVGYRGYFHERAAQAEAQKLRADGYDVAIGGVTAYSTLGRFADPVLNTMLSRGREEIASTIFHELAHQRIYVKGDTEFNESFASAVEELGIVAWFESQGDITAICSYRQRQSQRDELQRVVAEFRSKLEDLYQRPLAVTEKREAKKRLFTRLGAEIDGLFAGHARPAWFREPMNNATLIPLGLYRDRLPAFREMLNQCESDLDCFYKRAEEVAALSTEQRNITLQQMAASNGQPVSADRCSEHSGLNP